MGTVGLVPNGLDGSVTMSADGTTGTVTKSPMDGVTLGLGPYAPAVLAQALVNLDGDTLVKSGSSVINFPNQGLGGADYDLDVPVGTGANLRESISDACLMYGAVGDYLSGVNSTADSVTGDIDVSIRRQLPDWTPASTKTLIAKESSSSTQAYQFTVRLNVFRLITSPNGSSDVISDCTLPTGFADGTFGWCRFTVDVDDGLGNNVVKFYVSTDDTNDPDLVVWTQLGDTITNVGTTSIDANDSPIEIGGFRLGTLALAEGSVSRAVIKDGIDGTTVVDCNPADYVNRTSDTQFPSSTTGEVWRLNGNTKIQNTGHQSVATIASAVLETTAGQDIAIFTRYIVMRFDTAAPGADQVIFDARSDAAKSVRVFTDQSDSNNLVLDAGGTPIVMSATYATGICVLTIVSNGASSLLRSSGAIVGEITGNPGSETLDFGTILGNLSGALTWEGLYFQDIIADRAHNASEQESMQSYLTSKFAL